MNWDHKTSPKFHFQLPIELKDNYVRLFLMKWCNIS